VPVAEPPVNNRAETIPPGPLQPLLVKRLKYGLAPLADRSGTVMYNKSVWHRNSVNKSGSAPGIQLSNRSNE
jgi:hypothetical protein